MSAQNHMRLNCNKYGFGSYEISFAFFLKLCGELGLLIKTSLKGSCVAKRDNHFQSQTLIFDLL